MTNFDSFTYFCFFAAQVLSRGVRGLQGPRKYPRLGLSEDLAVQGPRKFSGIRLSDDLESVQVCEENCRQVLRQAGCSSEARPARPRAKRDLRDCRAAVRCNKKSCPPCVIGKSYPGRKTMPSLGHCHVLCSFEKNGLNKEAMRVSLQLTLIKVDVDA